MDSTFRSFIFIAISYPIHSITLLHVCPCALSCMPHVMSLTVLITLSEIKTYLTQRKHYRQSPIYCLKLHLNNNPASSLMNCVQCIYIRDFMQYRRVVWSTRGVIITAHESRVAQYFIPRFDIDLTFHPNNILYYTFTILLSYHFSFHLSTHSEQNGSKNLFK